MRIRYPALPSAAITSLLIREPAPLMLEPAPALGPVDSSDFRCHRSMSLLTPWYGLSGDGERRPVSLVSEPSLANRASKVELDGYVHVVTAEEICLTTREAAFEAA